MFTHGNDDGGKIYFEGDSHRVLTPKNINTYSEGRSRGIGGSGAGYETIKVLDQILSYVKDGGDVLFSTCWAARGEMGKSLAASLNQLTNQRVNLYLNQESSMRRYYMGYMEIWTGKPLSEKVNKGWVKVDRSGTILELKGHKGLRGNIRLDSRVGKKPINEE